MTPRPNIRRYLLMTGALTVLGALCVVLVIYLLSWQYKDDDIVTAKQCTDADTAASIERLEEGDVIKEDLTQTSVTEELCGEINARTLLVGTNPVAQAIEVERVVQEFRIIQDSMRAADENQSASRPTDSHPLDKDLTAGSPLSHVEISLLSFSQDPDTPAPAPAPAVEMESDDLEIDSNAPVPPPAPAPAPPPKPAPAPPPKSAPAPPPPPPKAAPAPAPASTRDENQPAEKPIDSPATPSISSDAREAVKDGASPKEAVAEAQAAGEKAGASKAAATAGAKNAVSLALIDGTMTNAVVKGNVAYNTPPQEIRWKDSTDMEVVLRPSTSNSIDDLEQKIKEVKEAGEVEVEPVDVSSRMEAVIFSTPEPAFDVSSITGEPQQPIISEGDTEWRWKVVASSTGDKDLHLKLSIGLSSPQEGESFSFRPVEGFPVSFEKISVKGTQWQNASNFVGSNWQWLWTAILIPLVAFLWGRRKKSSKSEDKGFVGSSWQWLRMAIIVPVAAFLRGRRKQSDKNKDVE